MTLGAGQLPDPRRAPAGAELLGLTGPLTPDIALAGYRRGLFAMEVAPGVNGWFSPDPRGVLPLSRLHISRSLRRSMRRFRITSDQAFGEVVAACADASRPGAWINDEYRTVYRALHARGYAHSIEVWSDDRLAGGIFGVELGGLFCGESMFHRETDASKVALVGLVAQLGRTGELRRMLDVQWWTPHLGSLGVVKVTRSDYLDQVALALRLSPSFR